MRAYLSRLLSGSALGSRKGWYVPMESKSDTLTQKGFHQAEVRKAAVRHCIINDSFSGLLHALPSLSSLRSRTQVKSDNTEAVML